MSENSIRFVGNFHSITIHPSAKLEIGRWVEMRNFSSLDVFPGAQLKLGDSVFINEHCTIRCAHSISIGSGTMIGDGARIYDQDHLYSSYHIDHWGITKANISIGKDCWIGANAVITKGVTIGDNVIIGAGTVVTKDIPSNSTIHGTGNIIKTRYQSPYQVAILTFSDKIEHLSYLLEELPEVDFHIAAPTNISETLMAYNRFTNCHLYTRFSGPERTVSLLQQVGCYLDINAGAEVDNIVQQALSLSKPVFAFNTVAHQSDSRIKYFSSDSPEKMVDAIKEAFSLKFNE
ncbi:acyltransferase [Streptococcus suis]|uniref:acyltransferase n=1 Tax=Streptococcus suis TaxID=1307 RepID=UPI000CF41BF4|nr:acyltransferase [Streptococcus suis]